MSEQTNTERAERGRKTLEAYCEGDGFDLDQPGDVASALGDLICDLHHYVDKLEGESGRRDIFDFEEILRMGQMHHDAEVEEEREDDPTNPDDLGDDQEPDESMDGDHASALASAGLGTDEDYRPDSDPTD